MKQYVFIGLSMLCVSNIQSSDSSMIESAEEMVWRAVEGFDVDALTKLLQTQPSIRLSQKKIEEFKRTALITELIATRINEDKLLKRKEALEKELSLSTLPTEEEKLSAAIEFGAIDICRNHKNPFGVTEKVLEYENLVEGIQGLRDNKQHSPIISEIRSLLERHVNQETT